jgi:lipopolysaccharide transport system permease protein
MLLAMLFAFAMSLWTSVWQARARDMRFVLGYVVGFWYLLTPIVYPMSHLPPAVRWLAAVNPMAGPVEAFKWALLGIGEWPAYPMAMSLAVTTIVLLTGLWYFEGAEGEIADRL